jgi:hypothetical protein
VSSGATSRWRSLDLGSFEKALFVIPISVDFDIPADSSALVLRFCVVLQRRLGNAGRQDHERGVRVQGSWLVKTAHFIMER